MGVLAVPGAFGNRAVPVVPPAVKSVIILAVLLASAFAFAGDAKAQVKSLSQIQQDINAKLQTLDQLNKQIADKTKAAATGQPAAATLDAIMSSIL